MNSPLLQFGLRYIVPLQFLFSVFLLLRGHNAPGGGFIGGLMFASCLVLIRLVPGHKSTFLAKLPFSSLTIAVLGLGLSLLAGMSGWLWGEASFLAALWGPEFFVPFVGNVKLGTVFLFDLGVYFVVVGTALSFFDQLHEGGKP